MGDALVCQREFQDGMQRVCKKLGLSVSANDLRVVFNELDTDGDGTLDFIELGQFVQLRQLLTKNYAQVVDLFLDFTQGQSSQITLRDFSDGLRRLQTQMDSPF